MVFSSFHFSSVQLLSRVNSLWPHEPQNASPTCPSPTLRAYPNSCPLNQSCHPTILFSVIPFSSFLQSFPASGSYPESTLRMRWPKYWSFSFSISPSNEHPGLMLFNSSSFFAIRVVSSANLRLLVFLPAILIPACASSSPAFLMLYSTQELNKQGDNI